MKLLDRDLCRIAYHDGGDPSGPPVVFTHSLGLDHRTWDAEAERLGDRYRVIRIDTRGHGRSDAPAGPYTLEQLGEDVLAVADHLGLERFHGVGLSLGGLTMLWLAIHHASRLRSATVSNTAARLGTDELWNSRIEAVTGGMAAIADTALTRFFTPGFAERTPVIAARVHQAFFSTEPQGYAGCCAALRDADLTSSVGGIHVPSLIIGGLRDIATPPDRSRELHEWIPHSELVLLEAAHLSNLEQPEAFADALCAHLARNDPDV